MAAYDHRLSGGSGWVSMNEIRITFSSLEERLFGRHSPTYHPRTRNIYELFLVLCLYSKTMSDAPADAFRPKVMPAAEAYYAIKSPHGIGVNWDAGDLVGLIHIIDRRATEDDSLLSALDHETLWTGIKRIFNIADSEVLYNLSYYCGWLVAHPRDNIPAYQQQLERNVTREGILAELLALILELKLFAAGAVEESGVQWRYLQFMRSMPQSRYGTWMHRAEMGLSAVLAALANNKKVSNQVWYTLESL